MSRVERSLKTNIIGKVTFTAFLLLIFLAAVIHKPGLFNANGQGSQVQIYPIDSKPFGISMADWSVIWWKWLLGAPQESSPAWDDTGKNCNVSQTNPNVWFLAQTGSGPAERTCTIPADRAILFPVAINECSFAENVELKTERELLDCAKSGNEVTVIKAIVDGKPIEDLQSYRVSSKIFDVTMPANNIFGVPNCPCKTKAVSDAFMVFLKPLSPGKHTLEWEQINMDNPTTGTQSFAYKVKYNLNVAP